MCGIAGVFGGKTKKAQGAFNEVILRYLMMKQDSRGRDNCGLYYMGYQTVQEGDTTKKVKSHITEWGGSDDPEGATKNFVQFLLKRRDELLPLAKPYKVIAHSRKASAGSTSKDNAHPFRCGSITGVHNGTLKEWKKLMAYLEVDIAGIDCDSEAIFKAIELDKTTDFLSMYNGAATLVWTDYKTGKEYVWCGREMRQYVNRPVEAAREFHMWETTAGIYFSSESGPLEIMMLATDSSYTIKAPYQVPLDTLIEIQDGKILNEVHIERNPFSGNVNTKTIENTKNKKPGDQLNLVKVWDSRENEEEDDLVQLLGITNIQQNKQEKYSVSGDSTSKTPQTEKSTNSIHEKISTDTLNKMTGNSVITGSRVWLGLENEVKDNNQWWKLNVRNGLYYAGTELCDTFIYSSNPFSPYYKEEFKMKGYWISKRYYVDNDGTLYWYNSTKDTYISKGESEDIKGDHARNRIFEVFFYKGIMIKDEKSLIKLLSKHKLLDKPCSIDDKFCIKPKELAKYAAHPVWGNLGKGTDDISEFYMFGNHRQNSPYMQGMMRFPYTDSIYHYIKGKPCDITRYHKLIPEGGDTHTEKVVNEWTGTRIRANTYHIQPDNGHVICICPDCNEISHYSIKDVNDIPHCGECRRPAVFDKESTVYYHNRRKRKV